MDELNQLKEAIMELYSSITKLRQAFGDRTFTPDGKLVGDIGEAIAALKFGVKLDKKSKKHWDGYWEASVGKRYDVQVRATQKMETYLKEPPGEGTFLVFKINPDGSYETIYNGSIQHVWIQLGQRVKIVSLDRLAKLQLDNDPLKIPV